MYKIHRKYTKISPPTNLAQKCAKTYVSICVKTYLSDHSLWFVLVSMTSLFYGFHINTDSQVSEVTFFLIALFLLFNQYALSLEVLKMITMV